MRVRLYIRWTDPLYPAILALSIDWLTRQLTWQGRKKPSAGEVEPGPAVSCKADWHPATSFGLRLQQHSRNFPPHKNPHLADDGLPGVVLIRAIFQRVVIPFAGLRIQESITNLIYKQSSVENSRESNPQLVARSSLSPGKGACACRWVEIVYSQREDATCYGIKLISMEIALEKTRGTSSSLLMASKKFSELAAVKCNVAPSRRFSTHRLTMPELKFLFILLIFLAFFFFFVIFFSVGNIAGMIWPRT